MIDVSNYLITLSFNKPMNRNPNGDSPPESLVKKSVDKNSKHTSKDISINQSKKYNFQQN